MRHLTDEVLQEAQGRANLYARIKHLDMFGVIGIIGFGDIRIVLNFVKQHIPNVRYSEQRGLVWMPTVGEKLDRQFSGLPQKDKSLPHPALRTPIPLLPWKGGSSDIKDY